MTNTAFFMAISGILRPAPAPAPTGITVVGSKATVQSVVFNSPSTAQTVVCALPSGCAAGDVVVISCTAQTYGSGFAWGVPSGGSAVLASGVISAGYVRALSLYTLTPTDIAAGTIGVPSTVSTTDVSIPTSVVVDVYRNVAATNIDLVGSENGGVVPASPASVTANGITTTLDGDMLHYSVFTNQGGGVFTDSTPAAGWTAGDRVVTTDPTFLFTGHKLQPTAGATGDAVPTMTYASGSPKYNSVMLSLRAYDPTFRLTGTLPAAVVGTAWTGVLTFAGDYTGPITVDAASGTIPAWMGSPTIDYTAKTITWSATPATGTDAGSPYAFTPRITDSASHVAVGPAQSVAVSAASALPSLVQQIASAGVSSGGNTATLPSAPTAGHTLLLTCWSTSTASVFTVPSGFVLQKSVQTTGTGGITKYFTKVSDGTESVINVTTSAGSRGFVIQEWDRAITLGTMTTAYVTGIGTSFATGPSDAPSGTQIPNMLTFYTGPSPTSQTWPAGWVKTGPFPATGFPYVGCSMGVGAATSTAVSPTITQPARGTSAVWANVWVS